MKKVYVVLCYLDIQTIVHDKVFESENDAKAYIGYIEEWLENEPQYDSYEDEEEYIHAHDKWTEVSEEWSLCVDTEYVLETKEMIYIKGTNNA